MNLNIFSPGKAVQSAIDRPDARVALLLVLIPTIASAIGSLFFQFPIQWAGIGIGLLKSIANWIILGILVYLAAYLVNGKALRGKFAGVLSAVSLVWIVSLLATLLGIIFFMTAFPASAMNVLRLNATGQLSPAETGQQLSEILSQSGFVNGTLALVFFGIGIILLALALLLLYRTISDLAPKNRILTKLILLIAVLIAWINIAYWISVF